jgi:hypothetical protein
VSKDKGGRQSKTPKATHNVKTKGQTPVQGSVSGTVAAGSKGGKK